MWPVRRLQQCHAPPWSSSVDLVPAAPRPGEMGRGGRGGGEGVKAGRTGKREKRGEVRGRKRCDYPQHEYPNVVHVYTQNKYSHSCITT